VKRLPENAGISFFGVTVIGRFDVDAAMADAWTPAERRAAVAEAWIKQDVAFVITVNETPRGRFFIPPTEGQA